MIRTWPDSRCGRRLAGAAILWSILGPAPVTAADLPKAVADALLAQGGWVNRLTVEWEEKRSSPLPRPALLEQLRTGNGAVLEPQTVRFARDGSKLYLHHEWWFEPKTGPAKPFQSDTSYDGAFLYAGTTEDASMGAPVLMVERIRSAQEKGDGYLGPVDYFTAAGVWVPSTIRGVDAPPRSLVLKLLDGSHAVADVRDGAPGTPTVVRLRHRGGAEAPPAQPFYVPFTAGQHEYTFWLDPAHGYAVTRAEERNAGGALLLATEASGHAARAGMTGQLPSQCRLTWHTWVSRGDTASQTPLVVSELTTKELGPAPPAERFVLDYRTPGAMINSAKAAGADKAEDGKVTYLVPADPADLDAAIRAGAEGQEFNPHAGRTRLLWKTLALTSAVLLLVFAARRWHTRRGRGGPPA